ncbi:MAG: hypothetical protein HZA03_08580 [Nitrospinae bacterium]|nr:hypothetical protein [Nitrospinota bacterium]
MKRVFLVSVVVFLLGFAVSCSKEPLPPPVTDSLYFNGKLGLLADQLAQNALRRPRRAAVLDFVNQNGKTSQLGKYVTGKFMEITSQKALFTAPSDGEVATAIKAQGIKYNGTLNTESAIKLGQALAVDALIVGILSDLQKGSDVDLVVKMIDVRNGNIMSAASTSFYRSKQVSGMLESF